MDFLTVQGEFMRLWYVVFWVSAWGFAAGVMLYIVDFFSISFGRENLRAEKPST